MVHVVLSGVLGAAVLAVVLLAFGLRKTRTDINKLHAELTATKIIALTGGVTTAPPCEEPPAPVWQIAAHNSNPADSLGGAPPIPPHRKNHLTLLKGGAVAAVILGCVEILRASVGPRRIATSIAAASLVVGTGAVYTVGPYAQEAEQHVTTPPATAPDQVYGDDAEPPARKSDGNAVRETSGVIPVLPTPPPSPSSTPSAEASQEAAPVTDEPAASPTGEDRTPPGTGDENPTGGSGEESGHDDGTADEDNRPDGDGTAEDDDGPDGDGTAEDDDRPDDHDSDEQPDDTEEVDGHWDAPKDRGPDWKPRQQRTTDPADTI